MGGRKLTILAFDTSAAHCAAAVVRDGVALAERHEPMQRGQAERLMPMLEEVLAEAGATWRDLDLIAVGAGPGSFTGVRIAVAAARGLSLALGVPALGVSMFEAARGPNKAEEGVEIISLPAPRGMAYVQRFHDGVPLASPQVTDPGDPSEDLRQPAPMSVIGYRASEIAARLGARADESALGEIARRIARCAEARISAGESPSRPVPLYVRPADAAPPREAPPTILP